MENITHCSFAVPTDYIALLNATLYYAEISSETLTNTPVFRIRVSINRDENPLDVSLNFNQNSLVRNLFEFENGENDGLDVAFPSDFDVSDDEYTYDTSLNFVPEREIESDIELDITISLSVLRGDISPYGHSVGAIGRIFLAPGKCIVQRSFLPHITGCYVDHKPHVL